MLVTIGWGVPSATGQVLCQLEAPLPTG
jgi:hypothetical protein